MFLCALNKHFQETKGAAEDNIEEQWGRVCVFCTLEIYRVCPLCTNSSADQHLAYDMTVHDGLTIKRV
jgi:hypothetical protein